MKKNFRNRLLAVIAAASSSFLLLSGFDSSLTAQDIQSKGNAAVLESNGMSYSINGTADLSIDAAMGDQTQSLPINGNLTLNGSFIFSPFSMAITGSASGDAAGMGVGGSVDLEMYMLSQEDGTGIMYVKTTAGGDDAWHAATLSAEDMSKMENTVTSSISGDISAVSDQLGVDVSAIQEKANSFVSVSPEAADLDGVECYELTASMTGDDIFSLLSDLLPLLSNAGIDESVLSTYQMFTSGLQVNTAAYYDANTFLPKYSVVDLGSSDFSMIAQLLGAMMFSSEDSTEAPAITLNVGALALEATFMDAPTAIEAPPEALAVQPETEISMSDATSALGTVAA